MPLTTACVESALATEVLEHVPRPEGFLAEAFRVLKSGGVFFFTTPFLWPLHDVPFDAHRLTPWSLDRYLREAGFTDIDLQPYGGWHRSLAQIIGLWVRRSPMSRRKRAILSRAAVPIVRYLLAHDQVPATFEESSMLPGIAGTARKPT
jgi:SAM-dependent methyltransferase